MTSKTNIIFVSLFSIFGIILFIVIISSLFTPNDNFQMSSETLINNLREDTQNYKNVNRGKLELYTNKNFIITGSLYNYDFAKNELVFDTIRMVFKADLNNTQISDKDLKTLKSIKRGYKAKVTGKFQKISNFIVLKNTKILKITDLNNNILINNE